MNQETTLTAKNNESSVQQAKAAHHYFLIIFFESNTISAYLNLSPRESGIIEQLHVMQQLHRIANWMTYEIADTDNVIEVLSHETEPLQPSIDRGEPA